MRLSATFTTQPQIIQAKFIVFFVLQLSVLAYKLPLFHSFQNRFCIFFLQFLNVTYPFQFSHVPNRTIVTAFFP